MGIFEGAELEQLQDLGELYIQSSLENIPPKTNFGLYRDDELITLRNLNGQKFGKKKKIIIKIFNDIGFGIDLKTNLTEIDVTLNLQNGTYCPQET